MTHIYDILHGISNIDIQSEHRYTVLFSISDH